ncbi:MAG: paraquat-inducible protein A [Candidatus Riflebacteria bacterium]|nr:paraquat-inducible protein A [Candidatus Riflebacteria bacterium]
MTPAGGPPAEGLRACPCCGLIQFVPSARQAEGSGSGATPALWACVRCATPFPPPGEDRRRRARTAACALAALILFPLAVWLPVLHLERFGHVHETGILRGCVELWADGHLVLAAIVFFCSFVFPLAKLAGLLLISGRFLPLSPKFRAGSFRFIELVGRWGMLDVLLVAVLVAAVKLGNLLEVKPGEGAALFTLCVALSLTASACYDPHSIWNEAAHD